MDSQLRVEAEQRGITRLCHFTPARNLPHILQSPDGILSRRALRLARKAFTPTDEQRLDCHDDHISCSIEYPNAWYFRRARDGDEPFTDWVILLLAPHHIWAPNTLFSPRNAAANHGSLLRPGLGGFASMYVPAVTGAGGRAYTRSPKMLPCCTTDQQAEVMVERQIPKSDILAVVVATPERAWDDAQRLRCLGILSTVVRWVVAPELFDPQLLHLAISTGRRPIEETWRPGA